MRSGAVVLALLTGMLPGAVGSQEPPTRNIVLQIVEREVRGDEVDAGAPVGVVRVDQGDRVEIRWSGDEATDRAHLGVIAEDAPEYIVDDERLSLSMPEYAAMLLGAVQVLAARLSTLEARAALPNHTTTPGEP